ncbi:MAG: hypothetical protein JSS07_06225 [Proteobacteria bacterium]|nr:hypothetical protein [Pseudomonadota bacterium]
MYKGNDQEHLTAAQAYLKYYRWKVSNPSREEKFLLQDELFQAWEYVDSLVRKDPYAGWCVTKILIEMSENDDELQYVAAGPLYDLLNYHLEVISAELAQETRKNSKMKAAVRCVPGWQDYLT